jgi:polysaccharide export outer membrane protein
MLLKLAVTVLALTGLCGCALLPAGSPTAREFENSAVPDRDPGFVLVDLDLVVAKAVSSYRRPGLSSLGADTYRPTLVLKVGDVIATTIYEVTPIPLFGGTSELQNTAAKAQPVGGHISTLPTEVVEQNGSVPVPFGGTVKVVGLTPAEAGKAIAKALEGKATNPQAIVSLVSSTINTASVNGDVNKPDLVPLTVRGERVLDVIAQAGGPKSSTFDEEVQMVRGGRVARINMQRLVNDAAENIRVRPGDSIVVVRNPRTFEVLGSALKVAQYDFNVEQVTLAEAVARSGGLNDSIADVGQLYLLRFEPVSMMRRILRPDDAQLRKLGAGRDTVPVAYHLDLRGASGYFVSQSVQMRDKDLVLITNAESVGFSKLVQIMRGVAGIYYDFRGPVTSSTTTRAGRVTTTTSSGGTSGD